MSNKEAVFELIAEKRPFIADSGVSFAEFLTLIKLFVQSRQFSLPWQILSIFEYNENLVLAEDDLLYVCLVK